MRHVDILFLFCVLICAGLFATRSITQSVPLLSGASSSRAAVLGVAGQPRKVDMRKLQRLLDRRVLSNREAEFYQPVDAPARVGDQEEGTGSPAASTMSAPSRSSRRQPTD